MDCGDFYAQALINYDHALCWEMALLLDSPPFDDLMNDIKEGLDVEEPLGTDDDAPPSTPDWTRGCRGQPKNRKCSDKSKKRIS